MCAAEAPKARRDTAARARAQNPPRRPAPFPRPFPRAIFPRLSGGTNGAGRPRQPGCGRGRPALPASLRRGLARSGLLWRRHRRLGRAAPWLSSASGGWSGSCTPRRGERHCPRPPPLGPGPSEGAAELRGLRRGRGAAPGGEPGRCAALAVVSEEVRWFP